MNSKMQKIVHFDLKGAPPKLQYFEQVLRRIKCWGATGVLLEWEDTFPYNGKLGHLGSTFNCGGDEMYTVAEVRRIFEICKELDLEVIQLVQTIGHLEFVLKHSIHERLREYIRSPSIICPEKQVSKELVRQMVMQALTEQPDAKYFHIGGDEVCYIAQCNDCRKKINRPYPLDHWCIYLDYIRDLVRFIKEQRPNITILMWDDMIRAMTPEILEGYRDLSENVQLVVWNYGVSENFRFRPDMWTIYKKYFPTVWAGSAFKGASDSNQLVPAVSRYVQNQEAWLREMRVASSLVLFAGVIFTGWSRFDHYATLCELLPTALNSLANCIKCFEDGGLDNCEDLRKENTLPEDQWPGKTVDKCVRNLAVLYEGYLRVSCGDLKTTWLNAWQVNSGFLNMFQVDNIENYVNKLVLDLKCQKDMAAKELCMIYGPRTRTEWVQTHFGDMEAGFAVVKYTIRNARRFDTCLEDYTEQQDPLSIERLLATVRCAPSTVGRPSMAASVITHGPSMVAQMPSVDADDSSMDGDGPSMVAQMPSVAADDSSMDGDGPSMVAQMPSVAADDSSMDGDGSSMVAQVPSVDAHGPSMPSVDADGSSMDADGSSMVAQVPSVDAHGPSMVAQLPSVDADGSSMVAQVPSVDAHGPSMVVQVPATVALVEDVPSTVA